MQRSTIEQWRMFKAVVDAGGFSQASEVVYKSQSSIHNAVSKLEDTLGIKLLEVQGRKTTLTSEGELLYRRACFLLDEVNRMESVAETLKSGVESELHIAVDGAFPQNIVYEALEKVSAQFPHLRFNIYDSVLSGANQLLREGVADLAISPFPLATGLNEEICIIEFIAVAHPNHPLHSSDDPLTFEDLKPHRQIITRDSATENKASSGWRDAEQRWTVGNMRSSIELVEKMLGFAWLPGPSIEASIEAGLLKPLNLAEGQRRTASFYLNYAEKETIGPATRELMGELRILTMDMETS